MVPSAKVSQQAIAALDHFIARQFGSTRSAP
jgi:hypothetical protein